MFTRAMLETLIFSILTLASLSISDVMNIASQLILLLSMSHIYRVELTSQVTEWSELTQALWSRLTSLQVQLLSVSNISTIIQFTSHYGSGLENSLDFWTDVGVGRNVDIQVSPNSLQSINILLSIIDKK